jgi:YesN/AraC family two-component response regulator
MALYSLSELKVLVVQIARSSSRAKKLVANNSYDLIITDREIEDDTGVDVIDTVRWGSNIANP